MTPAVVVVNIIKKCWHKHTTVYGHCTQILAAGENYTKHCALQTDLRMRFN